MCTQNVEKRIRAMGGSAVYGWLISDGGFYWHETKHCIWCSDDGELRDVTPYFVSVDGEMACVEFRDIEFRRDDAAMFSTEGESRYISKTSNPDLVKACSYMTAADKALYEDRLEAGQYSTRKANEFLKRAGIKARWDVPSSLAPADFIKLAVPMN